MPEKNKGLPLVSVVIPSYNHQFFVQQAIQSIIDQDYENIELIIIDDGSNDNSVDEIRKIIPLCRERFLRFEFRSRPNKGLCATLNEALEWCEGEFFSPIASDDIALPHKISFLVSKIKGSDYAGVFGEISPFSNLREKDIKIEVKHTNKIRCIHNFEDIMLQVNIPRAPAAMLRKSSIIEVGGYAEDVKLEDRYMWLSLTNRGKKLISFSDVIVLYRVHDNNTTNDVRKMQKYRLEVLSKFNKSTVYKKAVKKSYLVFSRGLSEKETLAPILIVLKSKNYNKTGMFITIRALTPYFLIRLLRVLK